MKQLLPLLLLCGAFVPQTYLRAQTSDVVSSIASEGETPASTASQLTVEELSARVAELTSTIETIETKSSRWDQFLARMPRVGGLVQAGYEWSESSSNFMIRRLLFNVGGDLGSKFDYRFQMEFVVMRLFDAYVQYKPFTELNLRVGEFPLPFLFEAADYSPSRLEFTEYSLVVQRLMGHVDLCGVSAAGRDVGFMAWGGFVHRDGYSIINYNLGVFNGEGFHLRDVNRSKDVVARLVIKPLAGLQLGGSVYWGETGADYRARRRYGVGVAYDRGRVVARGEYIYGITGLSASDKEPVVNVRSHGWSTMVGFRATKTLMPVVRYEAFVGNRAHATATRQTNYTAGLVWFPIKYLRCQLQYTYEAHGGSVRDRNVAVVMFSGIF